MPDTNDDIDREIIPEGKVQRGQLRNQTQSRRKQAPTLISLTKEDVESETVDFSEISAYVSVAFETDLSLALTKESVLVGLHERTNPEVTRKGVRIVWVEHAKTGELVPVKLRGGVAIAEDENVPEESDDNNNDDPNTPLLLPPSLTGKKGMYIYIHIYIYIHLCVYICVYTYMMILIPLCYCHLL
jgi:hypothetical protein